MIWEKWARGPLMDVFGVGAGIQGAAAISSAALQSHAINKATEAQQKAAENQLGFQKEMYSTQQQAFEPYLETGRQALGNLNQQMQGGLNQNLADQYGGQIQNFNPDAIVRNPDFAAPQTETANFDPNVNIQQDPGFKFRIEQGLEALQRSHTATGVSGGAAAKAITEYSQGLASQEYGQAYQRGLQSSERNQSINQQNFGQAAQNYSLNSANHQQWIQNALGANQANNQNALGRYNMAEGQRTGQFNREATLAGIGQTSNQALIGAGQAAAQGVNQAYAGMGNANSAGSAAQGNVWGNALNGLGQMGNQYMMMRSMGPQAGAGGGVPGAQPYVDNSLYGWE